MGTSTHGPSSETPLLDREAPLPPPQAPGSGMAVVLTLWLGGAAIVAGMLLLGRPPSLRHWILTGARAWLGDPPTGAALAGLVLSALGAYYAMIAVHELGHALAGLGVGFRLRSLRVGPLLFRGPLRVSLYRGPGAAINGVAELMPVATDAPVPRGVAMVLGGPAANFLSAIAVFALPFPMTAFTACFGAFSIANGLSDLVPFEGRLGVSDGRRIWMLLRQRDRGERWLALLRLGGDLNDGVLPESLSADLVATAIVVRDPSEDTLTAHGIAYSAAFHQHRDGEAGRLLETCLTCAGHAAPLVREALMSDAAVFQGRRRRRADLAEQWLAAMPAHAHPWHRSRAEAAVLEANGDIEGATRKLAEVERVTLSFPGSPRRETLLRMVERWQSDLRPAP